MKWEPAIWTGSVTPIENVFKDIKAFKEGVITNHRYPYFILVVKKGFGNGENFEEFGEDERLITRYRIKSSIVDL